MDFYRKNGLRHPMEQLDANEAALAARLGVEEAPYIPPAEQFYQSNYILDGCVSADFRTAYGYYASAQKQLLSFRNTQRADGMALGVSHPPDKTLRHKFTINPERLLSTAPLEGNDYTQTPAWARSVLTLHDAAYSRPPVSMEQAIDPDAGLRQVYPYLDRHYSYIANKRRVASGDSRVFILHPHEANRDSAPEYDEWKRQEIERQMGRLAVLLQRQPRSGEFMRNWFNKYNIATDYLGAIAINLAGYRAGWEPERVRESTGEFIDVWFNCHLCKNYEAMSELAARVGKHEDSARYSSLAEDLELAILREHYFADARGGKGGFYSTYNDQPVYVDSIGNLMTLLLRNLRVRQLKSNLVMMNEGFDTPYPLPSVSILETNTYDPHYQEVNRHWRGPKWTVADNFVMEGLDIQLENERFPNELHNASWEWFYKIHNSSLAVVALNGFFGEHYNPVTGEAQRVRKTRGHVFGIPSLVR